MGSRLYRAQASSKQRRCGGMGRAAGINRYLGQPTTARLSRSFSPTRSFSPVVFLLRPSAPVTRLARNQWQTPRPTAWIRPRPLMAPQMPSRPTQPLARRRHLQTRHRHHPRVRRRRMRQRQSQMRQRRTRTPRRSRVPGQRSQMRQQRRRSRTRQRRSRRQMRQLWQSQMLPRRQRRIRTPRRSRVQQRRTLMRRRPQRRRQRRMLRQWEGGLRRSRRL